MQAKKAQTLIQWCIHDKPQMTARHVTSAADPAMPTHFFLPQAASTNPTPTQTQAQCVKTTLFSVHIRSYVKDFPALYYN